MNRHVLENVRNHPFAPIATGYGASGSETVGEDAARDDRRVRWGFAAAGAIKSCSASWGRGALRFPAQNDPEDLQRAAAMLDGGLGRNGGLDVNEAATKHLGWDDYRARRKVGEHRESVRGYAPEGLRYGRSVRTQSNAPQAENVELRSAPLENRVKGERRERG